MWEVDVNDYYKYRFFYKNWVRKYWTQLGGKIKSRENHWFVYKGINMSIFIGLEKETIWRKTLMVSKLDMTTTLPGSEEEMT